MGQYIDTNEIPDILVIRYYDGSTDFGIDNRSLSDIHFQYENDSRVKYYWFLSSEHFENEDPTFIKDPIEEYTMEKVVKCPVTGKDVYDLLTEDYQSKALGNELEEDIMLSPEAFESGHMLIACQNCNNVYLLNDKQKWIVINELFKQEGDLQAKQAFENIFLISIAKCDSCTKEDELLEIKAIIDKEYASSNIFKNITLKSPQIPDQVI